MVKGQPTAKAAFEEVCAQHMGYANAGAYRTRLARHEAHRNEVCRTGKRIASEIMRGDWSSFDRLLDREFKR
jgi:hypothetical protein